MSQNVWTEELKNMKKYAMPMVFPNKDDWKRSDFYDCLGAFWAVKWGLHC